MSLYKDASLVMIPSAVKDGKLYSIRPTDGDGDFTFSRGSNLAATRVDVNGLIEKGRENVLLQSNRFDTTWANSNTTETGGQAGYDGSNDAWLLTKSAVAGAYIAQTKSTSGVSTASVYVKAGTLDVITLWCNQVGGGNPFGTFNLTTQTLTDSGTIVDSNITSVGNGWYRVSITFSVNTTLFRIYVNNFSDTTAGTIYIQDAQLESSMVATDYIETGASTAQAGILEDLPRLDYSGGASCPSLLLEPLRTNAVLHSEYFSLGSGYWGNTRCTIEDNSITSPEGAINAAKLLQDSSTTTAGLVNKNITASGTNTFSFFAKKGTRNFARLSLYSSVETSVYFDLENGEIGTTNLIAESDCFIENMGNDWYRCGGTYSGATNRFNIYLGDRDGETSLIDVTDAYIYIYGAQWEASKSYPTSYIPTMGSAVTRSGDSAIAENLGISDSYTLFIEYNDMESAETNFQDYIALQDSTSSGIGLRAEGVGNSWRIYPSGLTSTMTFPLVGSIDRLKKALVVTPTSIKLFEDGALRASTTGTLNSHIVDVVSTTLSTTGNAPTQIASSWKQLLMFPTALTDSECIALTTI